MTTIAGKKVGGMKALKGIFRRIPSVGLPRLQQCAYTACIMSKQYTIRSVPDSIDKALRRLAEQESISGSRLSSLNTI